MDSTLPSFAITIVQSRESSTLTDLLKGKRAMVLDFWHTKCTRCPAALSKLNDLASKRNDVLFVGCALSQGEGNIDLVDEMVSDGEWDNLTHVFMSAEVKELAKSTFEFSSVPHCIVVNKLGRIIGSGDPKSLNFEVILATADPDENSAPENVAMEEPTVSKSAALDTTGQTSSDVFTLDEDF